METQSIVILDFGAQYSQLIARRIREQDVFSVVIPCTSSLEEIKSYSPVGIILSGGPGRSTTPTPRRPISAFLTGGAGAGYLLRIAVYGPRAGW